MYRNIACPPKRESFATEPKPLEGSISAGYSSATGRYRTSASIGGTTGAFDYCLSFGKSDQGNRRTPDGVLAPTDVQDQSLTAHLGYTSGAHYWSFKVQSYDLSANVYTGGNPDFSVALPKRHLLECPLGIVRLSALNMKTISSILIKLPQPIFMGPPTVALRTNDARIKIFSIYAQHEADLKNTLIGFVGARFYKVDAALEVSNILALGTNSDGRLLGAASLVWTSKEELALRLRINPGYRYPTLQQMFMETTARGYHKRKSESEAGRFNSL